MWDIINARKEAKFTSFDDIKNRVSMLAEPVKLIAKRVHQELESAEDRKGKMKYIIFTRPPKPKKPR